MWEVNKDGRKIGGKVEKKKGREEGWKGGGRKKRSKENCHLW